MAWKTMDVREQRVRFVVAAARGEKSLTSLCQEFGISRPTGYLWLKRYQEAGVAGIAEKNRADPSGKDFIDVAASLQAYAIGIAQSFPNLTLAAGFVFSSLNIGLFITNDQFRNDVIGALGPSEAGALVKADLEMLFEYGGAGASALIRAVRGTQTTITLDLFGGATSQIPGAINVDLRAKSGVVADTGALPFRDESVSRIVASGPRAEFLDEASRVLKPRGRIYINATTNNPYAQLPDESTLDSLRLRPVQEFGPLDPEFAWPNVLAVKTAQLLTRVRLKPRFWKNSDDRFWTLRQDLFV